MPRARDTRPAWARRADRRSTRARAAGPTCSRRLTDALAPTLTVAGGSPIWLGSEASRLEIVGARRGRPGYVTFRFWRDRRSGDVRRPAWTADAAGSAPSASMFCSSTSMVAFWDRSMTATLGWERRGNTVLARRAAVSSSTSWWARRSIRPGSSWTPAARLARKTSVARRTTCWGSVPQAGDRRGRSVVDRTALSVARPDGGGAGDVDDERRERTSPDHHGGVNVAPRPTKEAP